MTNVTEKMYFYEINQQTQEPINSDALIELIKSGKISYGNAIWTEGFPDWIKVEHSEFKSYISVPPPVTPRKVTPPRNSVNNAVNSVNGDFNPHLISNVWVWLLAFSPFAIMIIASTVLYAQCEGNDWCMDVSLASGNTLLVSVIILVILNIILSLADENNLKKIGVDTKEMCKQGAWLVPAYLYQRATYLKHNLTYFIVWLISFALFLLVLSGAL